MNNLSELKSLLANSNLLNFHALNENSIDEMLDRRDDAEFEEDWLRVFQKLENELSTDDALMEIKVNGTKSSITQKFAENIFVVCSNCAAGKPCTETIDCKQ